MDFKKLAIQYKDELLDNVLPFWLENSQDHEYGGYSPVWIVKEGFSIQINLVWLQGREVWMFLYAYIKWKT